MALIGYPNAAKEAVNTIPFDVLYPVGVFIHDFLAASSSSVTVGSGEDQLAIVKSNADCVLMFDTPAPTLATETLLDNVAVIYANVATAMILPVATFAVQGLSIDGQLVVQLSKPWTIGREGSRRGIL